MTLQSNPLPTSDTLRTGMTRRRHRNIMRHLESIFDRGRELFEGTFDVTADLPAHDYRIDLSFDATTEKLVFTGTNISVDADGTFTIDLIADGQSRKILFVCTDPDESLTLDGIHIAQPGSSPRSAPRKTGRGPIADTPFSVDVEKRYLLLTDTRTESSDLGAWPYCLAFHDGSFVSEQDPEILNEGGAQ